MAADAAESGWRNHLAAQLLPVKYPTVNTRPDAFIFSSCSLYTLRLYSDFKPKAEKPVQ
jgi:hypothetical protein